MEITGEMLEKAKELCPISGGLGRMFWGQHFTPHGHTVGSVGEGLAANTDRIGGDTHVE